MRSTENNTRSFEVEYAQKGEAYTNRKFKKINILIFLVCLSMAFIFWCYALYIDDPIIQKNVTVNFVLVGGDSSEMILPAHKSITVYGEKSVLSGISSIKVEVKRSSFKEYNKDTLVEINYPKNIDSETKSITLKLISVNISE